MEFQSGRSLTLFPSATSGPSYVARDPVNTDDAPFIPNALDFAYRAYVAEDFLTFSIPPVFTNAAAVDSASFAGQGASFAVYRRRIPHQKVLKSRTVLDGWSVEIEDSRKLPDVVAYKVALIEFSDKGEASQSSRHAIDAAIMELYLSAHRPILQHPNLVDFFGLAWGMNPFSSMQKLPVLIVEFAECGSLAQLQQREYLSIETRRKLCLDICQGLHALHSCGIVHGDMKAENVLVFPDPERKYKAKLSDFGYSMVLNTEKDTLWLGGSRPWKAPETKSAVKVSDAKYTDVYSLALLIWCTFAHGRNIFRLLLDPTKQGDDFFIEAERMKDTTELLTMTGLSSWYLKSITFSPYGDPSQLAKTMLSLQQNLQQGSTGIIDPAVALGTLEEAMCSIPPTFSHMVEPLKQQLITVAQGSGLYNTMQRAVTIGLSHEPSQRSLQNIILSLGGNDLGEEMY